MSRLRIFVAGWFLAASAIASAALPLSVDGQAVTHGHGHADPRRAAQDRRRIERPHDDQTERLGHPAGVEQDREQASCDQRRSVTVDVGADGPIEGRRDSIGLV